MMTILGIDLGTTNSLAVAYVNGEVQMIPNQFNEYLTPSVVSIDQNNQVIIGKIAKERLITHPKTTANLFKRDMGTSKKYYLAKSSYSPEELSAFVIKQLVEDAKNYLHEEIDELVISVPAYFNAKQRRATKRAGELLGIKVERLINEPSAAAISCRSSVEFETFIVFDFGGGTLDVSVVDCFENVVSICSIAGNNNLGGSDFDIAIFEYFCKENHIISSTLEESKKRSLLLQAERIKLELQDQDSALMSGLINDHKYETLFTKTILKNITVSIFNEIKRVIARAVKDSGFSVDEFSNFILVGGSSYMPIIQEYLTDLIKIPVVQNQEIDLLVAKGLGKYIGIKQRDETIKDMVVTDICPFSLSTAVHNRNDPSNSLTHIIIPKNTVLPTSKTTVLYALRVNQKIMNFEVYQGEAMYVHDNLYLGETIIKLPTNTGNKEAVNVTYSYDINSMLFVEINVISTKKHYSFLVGDGNRLERVTDTKQIQTIKNMSIKLDKEPEIQLAIERASRLFVESDINMQTYISEVTNQFQAIINQSNNNVQKKVKTINQFNTLLDQIEKNSNIDDLDIFKNNSSSEINDDDEDLLS